MQCTDFLDTLPNAKVVEKEDTAMSARWISENQLKGHAAICGKLAAQIYNMEVLAEGIETNKRKLHPLFGNSRPMDGRRDAQR